MAENNLTTPPAKEHEGWGFDPATIENLVGDLEALESVAQTLIYYAKENQKSGGEINISQEQLFKMACLIESQIDGMVEDLGIERPLKIKQRFENNRDLPK